MTTNQQRAVEVLNQHWSVAQETQQDDETVCCVQALADAGLLMPDLPEPGVFPDGSSEWYTMDGYVNLEPGEPMIVSHDERDSEIPTPELDPDPGQIIITKPEYAVWLAHTLLAAAHHMERNL